MAFFLEAPFINQMQKHPKVQEEKQYICNVCSAKFYNEEEFRNHANSHKTNRRRARKGIPRPASKAKTITRSDSLKTFNQAIDNVIGHLQLDREEVPRIYNSFKTSFTQSANRNDVREMEDEEKPFVCETCQMAFAQEAELVSHMNTHKEEIHHACTKCDMQFADEETLRSHLMIHDDNTVERPDANKYHCVECGKAFTLKRTLKVNQDALPQRCTKCYMKAHMLSNPMNSFKCLACRGSFDSKLALTNHMAEHDLKKYKCQACGKSFADHEHLAAHMVEHTMRTTKNGCNHTDSETYKDFLEKKNLEFCHCSLCGRAFRRTSYLQRHMLTHSGPSPYKCLECKKSFTQKSRLNTHLLGSCGKRRYQCEKCQKCFYQKYNLMKHYLVHASQDTAAKMAEKSEHVYECNKCDRAFSELAALEQHQAIHSDKDILALKQTMDRERVEIDRNYNVSNQYPTVAHILDSPPVNRTVVQIVETAGNQTVMHIVESPAVSQPVAQVYHIEEVVPSQQSTHYHPEVMRSQDYEIDQAVAHILENSTMENDDSNERVAYPTVVQMMDVPTRRPAEQVMYPVETQTYVAPEVRPTEENIEKSKFQMIVQTMCNLLNSRSGN